MEKKKAGNLFNLIAPIYGLFYNYQKKLYQRTIKNIKSEFDIYSFSSVIDIGCGTGALCSLLKDGGMEVTGIDPAIKMIQFAKGKRENRDIEFIEANILEGLDFEDKSFDIAISSYVAHGLKSEERKSMYREMKRLAREYVVIHDYNKERSLFTNLVEWLEGGDYFNFIKEVEGELRGVFSQVRIIDVGKRASWYICRLN